MKMMFNKKKEETIIPKTVTVEEKKPVTLSEQINKINETLDFLAGEKKKGKNKSYKLKSKVKRNLKKIAKQNKVLVWILESNGHMHGEVVKMQGGYIVINGVPRKCTMDYRFLFDGKTPCIILPEWSLEPLGTKEYYEKNPGGMPLADAERAILALSQSGEVKQGGGMSSKAWVFIGLAVIAGLYVLFGGA